MDYKEKVCLVTGASCGVGYAIAKVLVQDSKVNDST